MKLGILCSGHLGFEVLQHLTVRHVVDFVFTDKQSASIIQYCEKNAIALFKGNPRKNESNIFIKDRNIDVLISINYLFLIEKELIELPARLSFNVHGSMLPKYRGRTPHVWSIINGETETGITAHLIDEGCDTGGIIEQLAVPIEPSDSGASILRKFNKLYVPLIDNVLEKIATNTVTVREQDHQKATFFGKRTPADGIIDWNWQKERIRNWVRAQMAPYPGAFSFYDNKKITIDEVSFCDNGFDYDMPNGLILEVDPHVLVKTTNGVIRLSKIREKNIVLETNKMLGYE